MPKRTWRRGNFVIGRRKSKSTDGTSQRVVRAQGGRPSCRLWPRIDIPPLDHPLTRAVLPVIDAVGKIVIGGVTLRVMGDIAEFGRLKITTFLSRPKWQSESTKVDFCIDQSGVLHRPKPVKMGVLNVARATLMKMG